MAAASTIIAAASLALAAGTTAYGIKNSNDQKAAAQAEADKQQAQQDALKAEEDQRKKKESDELALNSFRYKDNKPPTSRSSTVLTSPLGVQGSAAAAPGVRKTLLGQ